MRQYQVNKLLFASSSSVYGNNKQVPFSESHAVDNPISPYAATKKSGELLCHTYAHLYGIHTAALRFFTVYGPRQRPDLAIYKFTEKIWHDDVIPFYGDGTMGRDYTYVDDTVDGILRALDWVCAEENLYDVFNLGESVSITLSDMLRNIERAIGKKARIERFPAPPGDVNITCADISKAKNILDYSPCVDFDTGIERFVSWFRSERGGKQ
jgi:UDP-glucuronate 4-epimerase